MTYGEDYSRDEGTEETSKHRLDRKVDRHFLSGNVSTDPSTQAQTAYLEREENTADGAAKSYSDASSSRCSHYLPHFGCSTRADLVERGVVALRAYDLP